MASSARPIAHGAELAREAAKDGHDLVLVARRREPMEALAAELKSTGAEITVISADLAKPAGGGAAGSVSRNCSAGSKRLPALVRSRFAAWPKFKQIAAYNLVRIPKLLEAI